jgi:hypothetical protein
MSDVWATFTELDVTMQERSAGYCGNLAIF